MRIRHLGLYKTRDGSVVRITRRCDLRMTSYPWRGYVVASAAEALVSLCSGWTGGGFYHSKETPTDLDLVKEIKP